MVIDKVIIGTNPYYKTGYEPNTTLSVVSGLKVLKLEPSFSLTGGYFPSGISNATITIYSPKGTISTFNDNRGADAVVETLTLEDGTYRIQYKGRAGWSFQTGVNPDTYDTKFEDYSFSYYFAVVENKLPLKKWTITDVINRLLNLAEPLRKGETPRFRLNAEQAEKFDKILSPELSFTKQTLRECLQQIGGVIHGEPRLTPVKDENGKWIYEVRYDLFAGNNSTDIQYMAYTDKGQQHVIESYLGWLDSTAENLINQLDKFSGVVVEPYKGGAKSVRTENLYVRIEDGNMLIPTQYPIYTIEKLEYVYDNNGELQSLDITPYVFEKSEYDGRLSSYEGTYPYTKMYALYFTQGGKNISGLNFKVPSASPTLAPYKDYAITNILKQVTGNDELTLDYPKMCFRVTYTPFYDARIGQTKAYYKDFKYPAALIYNQQSNLIESRAYGENLKGTTARLGNTEISLTYNLCKLNEVAIAGLKYNDNYYISAVATDIFPTLIRSTIGLSKDFNRLSQYIGVSSVKRYYEVSKNQAQERNTLYREFVVIGEQETPDSDCLIGQNLLQMIAATFTQNVNTETFADGRVFLGTNPFALKYKMGETYRVEIDGQTYEAQVVSEADGGSDNYYLELTNSTASGTGNVFLPEFYPVTNVAAWGTSYQGNPVADGVAVNLPVISSAFGNSISFSWSYEDNYSAGAISQYQKNDKVSGYFQQSLPYGDYYGRLYYYNFDLQLAGETPTASNYEEIGQSLPKGNIPTKSSGYVSTIGKTPYIMRKDNREALQINFQVDFVTNLENIIIGSALASYCPAVRGTDATLKPKLYVFPTELNKFTDHVEAFEDVTLSQVPSVDVTVIVSDGYFIINAGKLPASGKSWAIVTAQTVGEEQEVEDEFGNVTKQSQINGGDLLIGQNIEVQSGQSFAPIYFTLKREIFDKSVWKDIY